MAAVGALNQRAVVLPGVMAMLMKHVIPTALLLAIPVASVVAAALTGGNIDAGTGMAAGCACCHGADGNSINPQFPKLAGQNAGYIYQQLQLFQSGERHSLIMASVIGLLSEQDMKNLAAYFAAQDIKPGEASSTERAKAGAAIYQKGKPEEEVAACSSCHGPAGLGNEAAGFPRIAGQHSVYLEKELNAFRGGTRGDSPQAAIMYSIARGM